MDSGKLCPSCGVDIGFLAVYKAGLPSRLRCPHCKTRVSYEGVGGLLALMILAGVFLGFAVLFLVYSLKIGGVFKQAAATVLLIFLAWQPLELLTTLYIRRFKHLKRRS